MKSAFSEGKSHGYSRWEAQRGASGHHPSSRNRTPPRPDRSAGVFQENLEEILGKWWETLGKSWETLGKWWENLGKWWDVENPYSFSKPSTKSTNSNDVDFPHRTRSLPQGKKSYLRTSPNYWRFLLISNRYLKEMFKIHTTGHLPTPRETCGLHQQSHIGVQQLNVDEEHIIRWNIARHGDLTKKSSVFHLM